VAEKIKAMSIQIRKLNGPPDVLASLALLVVMECDDRSAHDGVLAMLVNMVERASGSDEELTTRVAYAAVRYYYVMRHGWTGAALRYAVGDHLLGERYAIGMGDTRLDQEFEAPQVGSIRIGHWDPLASPTKFGYPTNFLVGSLVRLYALRSVLHLPLLEAEDVIYASGRASYDWGGMLASTTRTLSRKRVVDMYTLAAMAGRGPHEQVFDRYTLYASELTFSKLLGYRSVLRAYVRRSADEGEAAKLLSAVELMVARCAAGPGNGQVGVRTIHIVPVYDNPPPRPASPFGYRNFDRTPFTLDEEVGQWCVQRFTNAPPFDPLRVRVERRYWDRPDEESLACMLALSLSAPLLTCRSGLALDARFMGIGGEHPGMLPSF
jgi:hypothetical protein